MADKIDSIPFKIIAVDTAEHIVQFDPTLLNGITGPLVVVGEVTTGTIQLSVGPKLISSQSATYAAASNKSFVFTLPTGVSTFSYKATSISDAFVGSI